MNFFLDPARIVRDGALSPADALGVGRFTDVQRVSDGASVTLSCDTNGIDTPTTNWFLVNVTDDGCGVESPVTQGVYVNHHLHIVWNKKREDEERKDEGAKEEEEG